MRYLERRNGWDRGIAHPFLPNVLSYLGDLVQKSVLVVGAGPGHDAERLARVAGEVVALDFSREAEGHFKKYYPDSKVRYVTQDFFAPSGSGRTFDVVFEHTLLCAISPARYSDYFCALDRRTHPGSAFAAIVWNDSPVGDNGPPFSVATKTVTDYLKKIGFKIHAECPVDKTFPGQEDSETFVYAKKY